MPKLQESKNRFFISLPKEYVTLIGWKKGQRLAVIPGKEERSLKIIELPEVKE